MIIVFARGSAMILALPIVTAFGVVSTCGVESACEALIVPPPLRPPQPVPVVDVDVVARPPLVAVAVVVRRGWVGLAPGPGAAPSVPPPRCPGSLSALT